MLDNEYGGRKIGGKLLDQAGQGFHTSRRRSDDDDLISGAWHGSRSLGK
jgi:hypothetical protein